jgi:HTH-type transcriptional regulator/antitoxin HipB
MEHIARNTKQVGDVISRQRRKQRLTQGLLGEKTSLRQATISKLENGEQGTKLQTLMDVLMALDLELVIRPRTQSPNLEDLM